MLLKFLFKCQQLLSNLTRNRINEESRASHSRLLPGASFDQYHGDPTNNRFHQVSLFSKNTDPCHLYTIGEPIACSYPWTWGKARSLSHGTAEFWKLFKPCWKLTCYIEISWENGLHETEKEQGDFCQKGWQLLTELKGDLSGEWKDG